MKLLKRIIEWWKARKKARGQKWWANFEREMEARRNAEIVQEMYRQEIAEEAAKRRGDLRPPTL